VAGVVVRVSTTGDVIGRPFSEVIPANDMEYLLDLGRRFRITMKELGVVGGEHVDIEGLARVGAAELRTAWSEGFAAALGLEG